MGVSTIQLNESSLKQVLTQLKSLKNKLRKELKSLDATEKTLLGMWEGDAAKAFDASYQKDGAAYDEFIDLITKYETALENIMRGYEKGEKKNVQTAKKRSYK